MPSLLFTVWLTNTAVAHSPELHKKEKHEKPQCAAISKVDKSQIDASDAVMQAILIQCKDWLHGVHEDNEKDKPEKKNKDNHG